MVEFKFEAPRGNGFARTTGRGFAAQRLRCMKNNFD